MDCILADKLTQPHNKAHKLTLLYCVMSILITGLLTMNTASADSFDAMFGYSEVAQQDISAFPQWEKVLNERTADDDTSTCSKRDRSARCLIKSWHEFLAGLKDKPAQKQLEAVNRYANKQAYVTDQKNYGRDDHWAEPAAFLANGGDCEDFAILKFFSLRALGWAADSLRVVIVQDTRARQPHAVLAAATADDVWILDNQNKRVVSEGRINNYAPVYSVTDEQWWLHMPAGTFVADAR